MRVGRILSMTLICFVLGTMTAWQYKSIDNNNRVATSQRSNLETMQEELIEEKRVNENLRARSEEVKKQLSDYRHAKVGMEKIEHDIKTEIERAQIMAGLTDVKGSGVIITLNSYYKLSISDFEENSDFYDILMSYKRHRQLFLVRLINQLRAWEAKAISINDERIVAMTEVNATDDNKFIINGNYYSEPYVIKAIVPVESIDYLVYMFNEMVQIGDMFESSIEKQEDIIIKKYDKDSQLLKYIS
ncbi:UNVERIFIED_CONTAM: uncharacterized protein YlxW (UPF0749 family) [Acetivibrio alkalicellulosi]